MTKPKTHRNCSAWKALCYAGGLLVFLSAWDPALASAENAIVTNGLYPLDLYWHNGRKDNFTTGRQEGVLSATAAGYSYVRTEAYVHYWYLPGTVPLRLYWHPTRRDNFTTATIQGKLAAEAAGYKFVRIEGYVYPTPREHYVPLVLFYHPWRGDNFTTAKLEGAEAAIAAGYIFVRIEGWVFPTSW